MSSCAACGQGPADHHWTCQGWSLNVQTRWEGSGCWDVLRLRSHSCGGDEGISAPHSKGLSPAQPAGAVRALTLIKSRPILSLSHAGWVISGGCSSSYKPWHNSNPPLAAAAGALASPCAGNETSMAFLSHFWRSPAPFLFLFRTWTMCRIVDTYCSCELGFCPLLMQWKIRTFHTVFFVKPAVAHKQTPSQVHKNNEMTWLKLPIHLNPGPSGMSITIKP